MVVVFHRAVLYAVEYCVIAHRFCCPCALLYIARKGMYARETLVGFPLHVKSPARRRPLLRSKSAAPKRKTPLRVSFFLERATRLAGGPAGPPHAHGHQNMPPACFSRCARALSSLCPTWPKRNTILTDGVSFWSGRRGSNSLPRPWQGRALPDELRPHNNSYYKA